jgi:hypothetical protein
MSNSTAVESVHLGISQELGVFTEGDQSEESSTERKGSFPFGK